MWWTIWSFVFYHLSCLDISFCWCCLGCGSINDIAFAFQGRQHRDPWRELGWDSLHVFGFKKREQQETCWNLQMVDQIWVEIAEGVKKDGDSNSCMLGGRSFSMRTKPCWRAKSFCLLQLTWWFMFTKRSFSSCFLGARFYSIHRRCKNRKCFNPYNLVQIHW